LPTTPWLSLDHRVDEFVTSDFERFAFVFVIAPLGLIFGNSFG